jgi:4-amino-4-deoxy-L-arabinose transferase-like glycosyltransferase
MDHPLVPNPQSPIRYPRRLLSWLVPVLLFAIAFLARDVRLGSFSWPDEVTWTARSVAFYAGLVQGDLAATHQSDHPGVVPMWGYGGFLSLRALLRGTLPELYTMTTERQLQDVPALLATEALWTVLVTSLTVVGVYLLLKKMLGARTGSVAALLVALDPFYLVQSRVVHVDAILTSFMTLAALAMAVYLVYPARRRYLVLSAVMAGLAWATKSPAIVLAPLVAGGLVLRVLLGGDAVASRPGGSWRRRLTWAGLSLLAWAGLAWAVFLAVWPAAWLDPLHLTALVVLGSQWGVVATQSVNYFMGQVTATPGPLFYLVVGPLRMTPLTLILAPLAGVLFLVDLRRAWRQGLSARLAVLAVALALVLGFGAGVSLSARQGDRYLLPLFPMLDVLAALALMALLGWLGRRWRLLAKGGRQLLLASAVVLLVAAGWLPLAPYYGAYFNPLLGGGDTAVWAFPFGQGEGLDLAAAYLNQKEGAENLRVASFYPEELQIYFRGSVGSLRHRQWSNTWLYNDYVVFYVSQVQRELPDAGLVNFFKDREPEYVARVGGVDFAWVYKPPLLRSGAPPAALNGAQATFGEEIALTGYAVGRTTLLPGGPWDLTLLWQPQQPPQANYYVGLRLVEAAADVVWQTNWAPFEDHYPTSLWSVGRTEYDRQTLALPESLAAGQIYCLDVQLFDAADGHSLPLTDGGTGDWLEVTCLPAGEP